MKNTEHLRVGKLGEDIACRFLKGKGYSIVARNYRKQYGEIDIICKLRDKLEFVEVKTVARETASAGYRPEENVHNKKLERLSKTIATYLFEYSYLAEWVFSVITVEIDEKTKKARIRHIHDIPLF